MWSLRVGWCCDGGAVLLHCMHVQHVAHLKYALVLCMDLYDTKHKSYPAKLSSDDALYCHKYYVPYSFDVGINVRVLPHIHRTRREINIQAMWVMWMETRCNSNIAYTHVRNNWIRYTQDTNTWHTMYSRISFVLALGNLIVLLCVYRCTEQPLNHLIPYSHVDCLYCQYTPVVMYLVVQSDTYNRT